MHLQCTYLKAIIEIKHGYLGYYQCKLSGSLSYVQKEEITASATFLNINHAYVATLSLDNLTNVFRFVSNSKNCLQINLAIKMK